MADNNVHVKCSDGLSVSINKLKTKMDPSYSNQIEKDGSGQQIDRLKLLYPQVNENLTPLPRSWSSQEKCTSIGLTQNNLRVHYKGFYLFSIFFVFCFPLVGPNGIESMILGIMTNSRNICVPMTKPNENANCQLPIIVWSPLCYIEFITFWLQRIRRYNFFFRFAFRLSGVNAQRK